MDYMGLVNKFPVNRALTREERNHHLQQDKRSRSEPQYQLSVIRMNSTYLECVDKYFGDKGFMTVLLLFCIGALLFMLGMMLYFLIVDWSEPNIDELALILFGFSTVFLPSIYFLIRLCLLKECFFWTHLPMRFNRKTRKVHVFRQDGTVMTEDWDKLYFCLCETKWDNREVRAHRLAEDGRTVLETFGLPYNSTDDSDRPAPLIFSQWEFVRSYMEEEKELPELVGQVQYVMDVADKREGFWRGFWRQNAEVASILPIAILMAPLHLLYTCGRWLATHTSKIPQWPAEIEAECQIEPGDPHICDAEHLANSR